MEEKTLMDELGFVIAQNGKVFTFGEYKPYFLRDKENPHHFHSSAFKSEVINSEEWKELGLANIEIEDLRSEIGLLAQLGFVIALNATDGSFEASFPAILLAAPEVVTEDQTRVLLEKKEQLLLFDKGITHIRIIDKEGKTIDRPQSIEEYYEKYVESKIIEQSPKR